MDNYQIDKLCYSNPKTRYLYNGCLLENNFNLDEDKIGFTIINTNLERSKEIGHWVMIFNLKSKFLFFDSFAKKPTHYGGSLSAIASRCKILAPFQLQANTSITCGIYCIYFAYHLCMHKPIKSILKKFSKKNLVNNEKQVLKFYYTLTGSRYVCKPVFCVQRTFNIPCDHINCNCVVTNVLEKCGRS